MQISKLRSWSFPHHSTYLCTHRACCWLRPAGTGWSNPLDWQQWGWPRCQGLSPPSWSRWWLQSSPGLWQGVDQRRVKSDSRKKEERTKLVCKVKTVTKKKIIALIYGKKNRRCVGSVGESFHQSYGKITMMLMELFRKWWLFLLKIKGFQHTKQNMA